jgi:cobalt-zinc-cadmium efflux system protein
MKTEDVRQAVLRVPGVASVHDVHLWTVSSGVIAVSAHATVPDLARHTAALTEIRAALGGLGVALATVQLEVETTCARLGPDGAPAPHMAHSHGADCSGGHRH